MTKILKIEIPRELCEEEFEDFFRDNLDDLRLALDLELEDDRALVDEIEIAEFELTENSVHIEYVVQFSAYYGCRDANYADEDQRAITGRRQGHRFEFDIFVPPPQRDTVDEF